MAEKTTQRTKYDVGTMTRIGLMCAISTVLGFFPEIPMAFFAPWLKLDFAYIPMLLTGFALGFWPGFIVLAVKNIFQVITTNSAGIGQLADMIMGTAMLLPSVVIYRRGQTRKSALIGMVVGVLALIVAAVIVNRFLLLPIFLGDSFASFMENNPLILWIGVAPFNLIKGGSVCAVTFLLYKHLSPFLKRGLRA